VFTLTNFFATTSFALFAPLLLARTGSDEAALAVAQSAGALGGVAGGLLLSIWGGPKRRVYGVLVGMILTAIAQAATGLGQTVLVWAAASFFTGLVIPILNGSNQAIWQAKVAPDVQGRVFATRRLIAQITIPLGAAIAGPLADNLFEPAMREGGALAGVFGGLVGVGPGAGMGLMFVLTGLAGALVALLAFAVPAVRYAETRLPDHDHAAPPDEPAPAAT
jgi:MFS family permease